MAVAWPPVVFLMLVLRLGSAVNGTTTTTLIATTSTYSTTATSSVTSTSTAMTSTTSTSSTITHSTATTSTAMTSVTSTSTATTSTTSTATASISTTSTATTSTATFSMTSTATATTPSSTTTTARSDDSHINATTTTSARSDDSDINATTTITTITTITTTPLPSASVRTKVDVLGQSGKFTVYDEARGPASGIQVTMDAIREVDAGGDAVGTSGAMKHSLNTFAAQSFEIGEPEAAVVGSVAATKISFASPVSTVGTIRVDTYVLGSGGNVGPPGEQWKASAGDLKWSVELSNWTWCGCSRGNSQQTGAFVDLDITVKGLANIQRTGGGDGLELGAGMACELSSQVQVDGVWEQMPSGFPLITTRGSQATLTLRFPRFARHALYDPVITGLAEDAASTDTATSTTAFSGEATTSTRTATTATSTTTTSATTGPKSAITATITSTSTVTSSSPTSTVTGSSTTLVSSLVEGTVDLSVSNCTAFAADPRAKDSIASGIAHAAGVRKASSVTVTIRCARRLAGELDSSSVSRGLQGSNAVVSYSITVPAENPAEAVAVAHAIELVTPASLTQDIETAMTDVGLTDYAVVVSHITWPTISVPMTTQSPGDRDVVSMSRQRAVPAAALLAIAAAATWLSSLVA